MVIDKLKTGAKLIIFTANALRKKTHERDHAFRTRLRNVNTKVVK